MPTRVAAEPDPRWLMVVTDRRLPQAPAPPEMARAAAAAGVEMLQLREKDLGGRALLELARAVVGAVAGTRLRVLVNGRADVASLAGAHGVHLPEQGLPAADVRRAFPALAVGVSCHSVEAARRAEQAGAHYVLLGPVFATTGKDRPLGLEALAEAARALRAPVIAIGGIDAGNVAAVWGAGASGVAAIRAFLRVPLAEAARALRHAPAP
jgi:thiamine-phosphate pyrophosphorylase